MRSEQFIFLGFIGGCIVAALLILIGNTISDRRLIMMCAPVNWSVAGTATGVIAGFPNAVPGQKDTPPAYQCDGVKIP